MALIAVSQNRRVTDYLESVRRAGGDPVEVADTHEEPAAIVARVRGVMLTGGGDVDPALYGEAPHAKLRTGGARPRRLRDRPGQGRDRSRCAAAGDLPWHAGAERGDGRDPDPGHPVGSGRRLEPCNPGAALPHRARSVGVARLAVVEHHGRQAGRGKPSSQQPSPSGGQARRAGVRRERYRAGRGDRGHGALGRAVSAWLCSGIPKTSGAPASSAPSSSNSSRLRAAHLRAFVPVRARRGFVVSVSQSWSTATVSTCAVLGNRSNAVSCRSS